LLVECGKVGVQGCELLGQGGNLHSSIGHRSAARGHSLRAGGIRFAPTYCTDYITISALDPSLQGYVTIEQKLRNAHRVVVLHRVNAARSHCGISHIPGAYVTRLAG
jgi:hypothetical protein